MKMKRVVMIELSTPIKTNLFNNFHPRSVGDIFCMVGLKLLGKLGDSASVRDGTPRLQIADCSSRQP